MIISSKAKHKLAEDLLNADFLSEREKDFVKMRIGVGGYSPCTLQEIGDKYGISRERVRQVGEVIADKIKTYLPEKKRIANEVFSKSWISKNFLKEQRIAKRRAVIKRKRTLVRNRCRKLVGYVEQFAVTREGKEKIAKMFKYLRLKYRRNKSLFGEDVIEDLRNLRRRWSEVRKIKKQLPQ